MPDQPLHYRFMIFKSEHKAEQWLNEVHERGYELIACHIFGLYSYLLLIVELRSQDRFEQVKDEDVFKLDEE